MSQELYNTGKPVCVCVCVVLVLLICAGLVDGDEGLQPLCEVLVKVDKVPGLARPLAPQCIRVLVPGNAGGGKVSTRLLHRGCRGRGSGACAACAARVLVLGALSGSKWCIRSGGGRGARTLSFQLGFLQFSPRHSCM